MAETVRAPLDGRRLAVRGRGCRSPLASSRYYEWITHGLELYAALAAVGLRAVECFPTASWTRWAGARSRRPRAAWSSEALASFALADLPPRLSQDDRDAIGAALTARAHDRGETERFGAIVVPRAPDLHPVEREV